MNTQIDWQSELDSSFGAGADRPPADYLVPARTALRRRRTAMGAVALVSALVVGGIGWALAPGGDVTRSSEIASDPAPPTPSASESVSKSASPALDLAVRRIAPDSTEAQRLQVQGAWVELEGAGLVVLADATILEAVANPLGYAQPQASYGLAVERDGEERWVLLTASNGRPASSVSDAARKRHATFDQWLAEQVAFTLGAIQKSPVTVQDDGTIAVYANVELLESVLAPPAAAAYGPIKDAAAVKYVTPQGDIRFAIVHKNGDATTVDPAVLETPTMAAFLAHLQAQADNGEGLR